MGNGLSFPKQETRIPLVINQPTEKAATSSVAGSEIQLAEVRSAAAILPAAEPGLLTSQNQEQVHDISGRVPEKIDSGQEPGVWGFDPVPDSDGWGFDPVLDPGGWNVEQSRSQRENG